MRCECHASGLMSVPGGTSAGVMRCDKIQN